MLERIIGEDVELRIAPSADLALARLDPTQVEQIIMNLAVNARDAMPRGGTLTLETAAVALDAAFADRHLGVTPGRFAMLRVTDTGEGMSAATQARIFEPFFTTKDSSKGTGLGLSTVFGIVQQSGGTIWVDSAPGAGSTFTLYFPVVDELDEDGTESPPHDLASLPPRGDETILVVEDDPQVRSLLANILRRQGYALLVADSAADAAARSAAHAGPIDLLLTDVIMPRTSGPRLADSLVARRPAMKVLFLSGYADDAVADQAGLAPGSAYLQKPIAVETLTRKVRELLDARASSSGLSAARGASGARRASRAPSSSRGG
jgi:CheY-like chemotaxis protein